MCYEVSKPCSSEVVYWILNETILLGTPTILGPYNKILPTINATNLDPQGHLNHKPVLWGMKACSNDSKVAFGSS